MKNKTFKITEVFLLISLPVSILVACNDGNENSETMNKTRVSVTAPEDFSSKVDIANKENKRQLPKKVDVNSSKATTMKVNLQADEGKHKLEIVKVPNRRVINFSTNQFNINAEQRNLIKQHAQYLRYNPNSTLMISGFSDSQGPADLNYELSKKRAKNVYDEFRKLGILADQLEFRAYGEAFALQTASSGYDDRRVELDYVQHQPSTTAMLNK